MRFIQLVSALTTANTAVAVAAGESSWVLDEAAYDAELVAAIKAGVQLPLAADVPATASGCPARYPTGEPERKSEFERIHGAWPPRTDAIAAAAVSEPARAAAWSARRTPLRTLRTLSGAGSAGSSSCRSARCPPSRARAGGWATCLPMCI